MRFASTPTARRRLCSVMLFVWLFAVLGSTVNACVLSGSSPVKAAAHQQAVEYLAHEGKEGHEAHDGHDDHDDHGGAPGHEDTEDAAAPAEHHHHDQADEHASCHKFCKDESTTLPQTRVMDDQDFTPVLLSTFSSLLPDALPLAPLTHALAQPRAQGPPLVIRFLRLTL